MRRAEFRGDGGGIGFVPCGGAGGFRRNPGSCVSAVRRWDVIVPFWGADGGLAVDWAKK